MTLAALAALTMGAGPALAEGRAIYPDAKTSCGAWTSRKGSDDEGSKGWYYAWMWGYVSRANSSYGFDLLTGIDPQAVVAWVDNYCATHPLDDLKTAAGRLEYELVLRNGPKR